MGGGMLSTVGGWLGSGWNTLTGWFSDGASTPQSAGSKRLPSSSEVQKATPIKFADGETDEAVRDELVKLRQDMQQLIKIMAAKEGGGGAYSFALVNTSGQRSPSPETQQFAGGGPVPRGGKR